MTAHIVNADNPSPAPTHSVAGVPVVDADSPSSAPAQSQPSVVPVQDTMEATPEPAVEVHDHAVDPAGDVEDDDEDQ